MPEMEFFKMITGDILVVDDDSNHLLLLRLALEMEGFDVVTARDGIEALEILENTSFRMIITDLNMPHMSGLELTTRVRKKFPEIHVMLVTANRRSGVVTDAVSSGVTRIFFKPLNMEQFTTEIRSTLQSSAAQKDQQGSVHNEIQP